MARWDDVAAVEPDFAARVRQVFEARRHKTMATLRKDGSPRISGIETQFADGEVWLGMMPDSVKARDLRRDPRVAVHSASDDPPTDDPGAWGGDAKLAGRAVAAPDPRQPDAPPNRFRVDISEVVLTRIGTPADHLVIESWHEGRGLKRWERH